MFRFFVSDLDGTLLDHTHRVDDEVLKGIKEILAKGHYFAICTGRSMQEDDEVNFGIEHENMYTICMNGAIIYKDAKTVIKRSPMAKEAVSLMIDTFPELFLRFEGQKVNYYPFSAAEGLAYIKAQGLYKDHEDERMQFLAKRARFGATKEEILADDIYKVNFSIGDIKLIDKMNDFLYKHRDLYVNSPWAIGFYDIVSADVNKGVITKWLCNYLNISEDETCVYGDSYNDFELMEMFKHSYAPSNAIHQVKHLAGNIIGDYDDHSVIKDMLAKLE